MKLRILAIGKARGVEAAWCAEYLKRLGALVTVEEWAAPKSLPAAEAQKAEAAWLLKSLAPSDFMIALDERGKDMPSRDFAARLDAWLAQGRPVTFLIGGADGLTDTVRARADILLGLGKLTWPHRLVRVMLLEQIYRARQISAGHPYHRD